MERLLRYMTLATVRNFKRCLGSDHNCRAGRHSPQRAAKSLAAVRVIPQLTASQSRNLDVFGESVWLFTDGLGTEALVSQ